MMGSDFMLPDFAPGDSGALQFLVVFVIVYFAWRFLRSVVENKKPEKLDWREDE
jgi:hypothetical protein